MKINYLIGALIALPFVPPVAALLAVLFVLVCVSDRQFDEKIEALGAATTPTEQAQAAASVVSNGCTWVVILAAVSFGGAFALMAMEVGR